MNKRGHLKLTEEAVEPTMRGARFGKGYGHLVRQRRELLCLHSMFTKTFTVYEVFNCNDWSHIS
jgi:hypothetical protein